MERKHMVSGVCRELLMGFNEDSIRERKVRIKSTTPVHQTVKAYLVTNTTLDKMVGDRKYKDFHGSTRGNMMSLISWPSYDSMWHLPPKQKQLVYAHSAGTRRIFASAASPTQPQQPSPDDPTPDEVVFYNTIPSVVWVNLLQRV